MRKKIINYFIKTIKQANKYDDIKLVEIKYGLESIYLTLSKLIIIVFAAYFLNIFIEVLIFIAIYNIIRLTSFGLHATKSWICLVSSLIIFIGCPMICQYVVIPIYLKSLIGITLIFIFYKCAPADTKKRPIVSPTRRLVYKTLSVSIVSIFSILSLIINNNFIANCLLVSIIIQAFMILPITYKLFKLSYNNYKTYVQTTV